MSPILFVQHLPLEKSVQVFKKGKFDLCSIIGNTSFSCHNVQSTLSFVFCWIRKWLFLLMNRKRLHYGHFMSHLDPFFSKWPCQKKEGYLPHLQSGRKHYFRRWRGPYIRWNESFVSNILALLLNHRALPVSENDGDHAANGMHCIVWLLSGSRSVYADHIGT